MSSDCRGAPVLLRPPKLVSFHQDPQLHPSIWCLDPPDTLWCIMTVPPQTNTPTYPPTTRTHTKETVEALCQILWSVCEGSALVPQNKFLTFCDNSNVSRRSFCVHERQSSGMENATVSWQSLPIVSLFNQSSSVALNIPVVCIYAWEKAALCPAQSQNTPSHPHCLSPRIWWQEIFHSRSSILMCRSTLGDLRMAKNKGPPYLWHIQKWWIKALMGGGLHLEAGASAFDLGEV